MEQAPMQAQCQQEAPQELSAGGVPAGSKTSDFYRTKNIPDRFDNPEWLKGYAVQKQHPMYITSASTYGGRVPTVHTMPKAFHARSQRFTEDLGKCGMYRNHSLNTAGDQSKV